MDDVVDDRIPDCQIANDVVPASWGNLACDQQRALVVAYPSGEGRGYVRLGCGCDVLAGFVPVPRQQLMEAGCGVR